MPDYTIPAPAGQKCKSCGFTILQRANKRIVRFNGGIYHKLCFARWHPFRKSLAAVEAEQDRNLRNGR